MKLARWILSMETLTLGKKATIQSLFESTGKVSTSISCSISPERQRDRWPDTTKFPRHLDEVDFGGAKSGALEDPRTILRRRGTRLVEARTRVPWCLARESRAERSARSPSSPFGNRTVQTHREFCLSFIYDLREQSLFTRIRERARLSSSVESRVNWHTCYLRRA